MNTSPTDRLKAKQPRRITVGVFLDEAPADRLDAAVLAAQDARRVQAPAEDIEALETAVAAAQAALDDITMWFTFQALGSKAFARLLDEHPPTAAQLAEAEQQGQERPEFDGSTFAPALLTASCIAPALTAEDFDDVYASDDWNDVERGALFGAALGVNVRARPLQVRAGP